MCREDTISTNSDDNDGLRDVLESRIIELFDESSNLPITITRDDGTTKVEGRIRHDGSAAMVAMAEAHVKGIPPNYFKGFLVDFRESTLQANPTVSDFQIVEPDPSKKREGVKLVMDLPFPLSNRVMLHYKYLTLNRNGDPDEHLLILSEKNNQALLEKFLTPAEERKYVLAKTFLGAYWLRPVRDPTDGSVTGTTVRYVFSGDMGGSLPKKILEWSAPKTMLEGVEGIVAYGKKKFANQ